MSCARGLNALLYRNIASDRFITFFYAHLDGPSRTLQYVNAGHNPPIVLHQDGSHERLTEGGGVFGVFPNQTFGLGTTRLDPGDRVVLYTDGVTEAADAEIRGIRRRAPGAIASGKFLRLRQRTSSTDSASRRRFLPWPLARRRHLARPRRILTACSEFPGITRKADHAPLGSVMLNQLPESSFMMASIP